ncbi:MAG: hypothetical protein Kilf2KO_08600 [Rhodospirillales bacterium]
MNEFTPTWLSLREARDSEARDRRLLKKLGKRFASAKRTTVCDLGAGTASLLRALAPHLPRQQEWILVDREAENLTAARDALTAWAERSDDRAEGLTLKKEGREIAVTFRQADLTRDLERTIAGVDLVAASALFDLAGTAWIGALAKLLARGRQPLYASLTFTGTFAAEPALPLDGAIAAAFGAHQRSDKGLLGVAAGPSAQELLTQALLTAGAEVASGDSTWHLSERTPSLVEEVIQGFSTAAAETGLLSEEACRTWRIARLGDTKTMSVGHADLFATWPAADAAS